MLDRKILVLIIGVILLIGSASALLPDKITITSSADADSHFGWLVANGTDYSVITIQVQNISTSLPVNPASISVSADPLWGFLTNTSMVTNPMGFANTVFYTNKTSNATFSLVVKVTTSDGSTTTTRILQIDHDIPHKVFFDYQDEVIVSQSTPFIAMFTDAWGNRIDNKNPFQTHTVIFHYYPPPAGLGTGGFVSGGNTTQIFTGQTDAYGNISTTVEVDTVQGENNIWMEHLGAIPDQYPFIVGITQAPPFSIGSVVSPPGDPGIPADNTAYYTITYTLWDKFGNPAANQTAKIFTSNNETIGNIKSNSLGQIWVSYGPKSVSGQFNITAVAIENTTVSCSNIVNFYSTAPAAMEVSANPQMMPSRDVPGSQPATIYARIMDIMGNPSQNQSVTFTLTGYTNSTILTTPPSFSSGTYTTTINAITGSDGNANATFYPGAFPTSGPYYNSTATGTATILATWMSMSMPITVTFKNYPYLRVETSVNPTTVSVNSTINVDIKLIGDGWKLQPIPADIVIVTDLAGGIGGPTRMADTKTAEIAFIQNSSDTTYISLVSFGRSPTPPGPPYASANAIALWNQQKLDGLPHFQAWSGAPMGKCMVDPATWNSVTTATNCNGLGNCPNVTNPNGYYYLNPCSDAKIEMDFTDHAHQSNLITLVNGYQDYGGTDYAAGINAAIQEFNTHGTPGHSKTIVIMGDGVNMMAPIAPGSLQSYWPSDWYPRSNLGWLDESDVGKAASVDAATRAKAQGITIYGAGFPTIIGGGSYVDTNLMNQMTSPGCYYYAPSTTQLSQIFQTILGKVQSEAGVNTQMNLDFHNVNVTFNNVTTQNDGKIVLSYNYTQGVSTWVTSWNKTMNPLPDHVPATPLSHPNVFPYYDGTYTTYPYSYDQTNEWSTSALNFNIGNISVNQTWETKFQFRVNATGVIELFGPGSQLVFNNGESVLQMPSLYINSVQNLTNSGINATTLVVSNLHSTATGVIKDVIPLQWNVQYNGNQTITERLSYSINGGPFVLFHTQYVSSGVTTDYGDLDVRYLPPGSYIIRIDASANYAPDSRDEMTTPITIGTTGRSYIKLE
ncbi:MAG: hypothetical protein ABR887_08995 [Methanoregulaceae archaeon]|jgi:hypothetical protein